VAVVNAAEPLNVTSSVGVAPDESEPEPLTT
jgi:hypothetical protein